MKPRKAAGALFRTAPELFNFCLVSPSFNQVSIKYQSSKGAVNRARALHVRRIRAKSKAGGETHNRTKKAP